MKKFYWVLVGLLAIFVGLIYWSLSSADKEFETAKILSIEDVEKTDFREYDSILVATSTLYHGNWLKETMQGSNYRSAWETPVKIPIVFLDTLKGGLKVVKEGGGSQTHSLRLQNPAGITYTLRSINKDPGSHVPEIARTLGLENIVIDGVSAQHPFGAVAAAALAEAAGILHTHPQPFFVPKQEALGEFNEKYGNRLYLLEYETEGEVNWTPIQNVSEIVDTEDLLQLKQAEGKNLKIDKESFVRARLFDLLIGDWDRHAKQWGWVVQKNGNNLTAYPLPGDRDNAFFKLDGIIPGIITNQHVQPLVRPFEKEIDHLPGLVYPVDVYFLKNTPEKVFIEEAKELQQALTDEKIENALKDAWPPEIYRLNGKEILEKVKQRRDDLVEYAVAFHKLIEGREYLSKPLKGSEELTLSPELIKCFECAEGLK